MAPVRRRLRAFSSGVSAAASGAMAATRRSWSMKGKSTTASHSLRLSCRSVLSSAGKKSASGEARSSISGRKGAGRRTELDGGSTARSCWKGSNGVLSVKGNRNSCAAASNDCPGAGRGHRCRKYATTSEIMGG